ncbi:MAG: hypothetical protein DRN08_05045, partial [Thermoplasmata archaeon]
TDSDKCLYTVGPHNWTAGLQSNYPQYNMTNITDYLTLTIVTEPLEARIVSPYNQTRRKGIDSLVVKANVSDDCGLVSGATPVITIQRTGSTYATCCQSGCDATIYDEGNGTYNCTFSASTINTLPTYGLYNLTINATKQYYNHSLTWTKEDAFRLVSEPSITNLAATPAVDGGWGETWTFSATVYDPDQDNVTVSLWFNYTGDWVLADNTVLEGSESSQPVNFPGHTFFCNDSVDLGTKFFKINASDVYGYKNNTEISTYDLQPDDTSVDSRLQLQGQDINREGTATFQLWTKIADSDRGYIPVYNGTNATIWITYDGTNYDSGTSNQTDSDGNITYEFDPNCSYQTGIQYWKARVVNDVCYKNSPEIEDTFTIIGQLKNNLTLPVNGSEWNITNLIPVNFTTLSDCSDYIASENPVTSTDTESIELSLDGTSWESCSAEDSGSGWVNCTFNSTDHSEGWWDVRLNTSKQYFNDNSSTYTNRFWLENKNTTTDNQTIWIYNSSSEWEQLTYPAGWTRLYNYTIDIYDVEGDTINCSLFISKDNKNTWIYKGSQLIHGNPGAPTQTTCNVTINDFDCSDMDSVSDLKWFKWQIDDGESSNKRNTTAIQGPNLTVSNISLTLIEGNEYIFNRSSGPHQIRRLSINAYDTENYTYTHGVNVSFWLTNETNEYRLELINKTDSEGNSSYYFNPNCSHSVGQQYWIAGTTDSCYQEKNATQTNYTYNVTGDLQLMITSPNGEKRLRGEDDIILRGNIHDECGIDITSATVNLTSIHQDSSEEHTCSSNNNENNGTYNCTITGSSTGGWTAKGYNIKFNASANNYNYNSTIQTCSPGTSTSWCTSNNQGFWLETKPIINNPSVSSSGDGGWGETWTFQANITDEDYDNLRVRVLIRKCNDDLCDSPGSWETAGTNVSVS